jgi:hypothetical protein
MGNRKKPPDLEALRSLVSEAQELFSTVELPEGKSRQLLKLLAAFTGFADCQLSRKAKPEASVKSMKSQSTYRRRK